MEHDKNQIVGKNDLSAILSRIFQLGMVKE
jgi:hypothetical protein